jgi:hypothetical protein
VKATTFFSSNGTFKGRKSFFGRQKQKVNDGGSIKLAFFQAEQRSRLEAAHHFVVGRLAAEVVEDKFRVTFSPPALAAVANLSLHYIQESAEDLEAFAK